MPPAQLPSSSSTGSTDPRPRGMKIRIGLYWTALIVLVGIVIYGLMANPHILLNAWTPLGLRRFLGFAGGSAMATAVVYVVAASRLPAIVMVVATVAAIGAVGFAGPLTAAAFLFSALVLGKALLFPEQPSDPTQPIDMLLAALVGASIYMTAIGLTAAIPIHYAALHAAVLALPLVLFPAAVRDCIGFLRRVFGPHRWAGMWDYANFAMFAFILLCLLVAVLLPQVNSDAVVLHLALPSVMANDHAWSFDAEHYAFAFAQTGTAWMLTPAYLLGGEYAARLVNFSFYIMVSLLLFTVARRFLSTGSAWLIVAIFASTPFFLLETGNVFSENVWIALLFGGAIAMDLYRSTGRQSYFWTMTTLTGASITVKILGAVVAALIFATAALRCLRRPVLLATGSFLAALFALYPFVWSFIKTGNPVFPFMNNIFKSPYFAPSAFNGLGRHTPPNPYDLTFHTLPFTDGGASDGSAGFAYLVLIPIAFIALRRSYPFIGWFSLAAAVIGLISEFQLAEVNLRYMYLALPFAMVMIAIAYAHVRSISKPLFVALCGFGVAITAVNTYAMPVSGWAYRDFALPSVLTRASVDQRRDEGAPERRMIDYLNLTRGYTVRVAFFSRPMLIELKGNAVFTNWYNYKLEGRLREAASISAEAVFRLMMDEHITSFIGFTPESRSVNMYPAVDEFLKTYTEREFAASDVYLTRLKEPFRFVNEVVTNGDFKNGLQSWTTVGATSEAVPAVVSIASGYRQRVAVDDRLKYRYALTTRCPIPDSRARLEVNWLDAKGRGINGNLAAPDCTAAWQTRTMELTPPAGATSADITLLGLDAGKTSEISDVSLKW